MFIAGAVMTAISLRKDVCRASSSTTDCPPKQHNPSSSHEDNGTAILTVERALLGFPDENLFILPLNQVCSTSYMGSWILFIT